MTSLISPAAQAPRGLLPMAGALYLVQGLPVGLAFQAYPVLLRDGGASLDLIALVPVAGLPWVFKFAWAAVVENRWWPAVGRRRSWILPMQALLALCLAAMAALPFTAGNAPALLALVALASLVGATQDIATDGLAADRLHGQGLTGLNAFQVAGFMTGMLLGGPGLMLARDWLGHAPAMLGLAAVVGLCGLPVLRWREPPPPAGQAVGAASLRGFLARPGGLGLLALGMCATAGGAVAFGVAKLFLIDAGWPVDTVGLLSGTGNTLAVIAGCGVAAWTLGQGGVAITLLLGAGLVGGSAAGWVILAIAPDTGALALVWSLATAGGLGIGVCTVASYALLMRFAGQGQQPGTDYAVFQGMQTLGEIVMMAGATAVAGQAGYPAALGLGVALAVLLAVMVAVQHRRKGAALLAIAEEGTAA